MGTVIAKLNAVRESGFLYYVKTGADGKLEVWKAVMARGGKKTKKGAKK